MTITRADVAKLAGVSPAVVSYVINDGPRGVSADARARVEAAIETLGYRPNAVARALRKSSTQTIGLIVPNQTNEYFAELTEEIERQAFERDYLLLVGITHDELARERRYVELFVDRRVDGLLVISGRAGELIAHEIRHTPAVAVDRAAQISTASDVYIDNQLGARQTVEHLQAHGIRTIACIAGPRDILLSTDRESGWREQTLAGGQEASPALVLSAPFTSAGGREGCAELLAREPMQRALANGQQVGIFVSSDAQAQGVYQACAERGLRIPDDIAVVSFDGSEAGAHANPTLTSYRQPTDEIARVAIEELVRRIDDASSSPQTLRITGNLRIGASCGCPVRVAAAR